MEFRQLLPEPRAVHVGELLAGLDPSAQATPTRPHTVVNFIASVDGHATFGGRSGALGDDGDRAMFHGLREQFDAILAGTGTLRTERYGRLLGDPERRRRRAERGLSPEPLACILSRSGELPLDIPLFDEPEARIVVVTPGDPPRGRWRARVEHVRLEAGQFTLAAALQKLRSDFDVRSLLCEGGPSLFGAMLREFVVDELFLTLAPRLTGGGDGPPMTTGSELPEPASMRLLWLLERAGSMYLRYRLLTTD